MRGRRRCRGRARDVEVDVLQVVGLARGQKRRDILYAHLETSFETAEGYPVGSVQGRPGWSVLQGTAAVTADGEAFAHSVPAFLVYPVLRGSQLLDLFLDLLLLSRESIFVIRVLVCIDHTCRHCALLFLRRVGAACLLVVIMLLTNARCLALLFAATAQLC